MVTTGCVVSADPAVPFPGWVVNTSWVAAPAVTLKLEEVAPANDPDVAEKVYPVPDLLIESPEKVAIPFTAATVTLPAMLPDPGFEPRARVTELVAVVTVFP